MGKKNKFYVVWKGRKKGIFTTWEQCNQSINGYNEAQYKSFETLEQAKHALTFPTLYSFNAHLVSTPQNRQKSSSMLDLQTPILNSIATDAACSGNPGLMEYRGVHIASGKQVFYYRYPYGTNNIGEFLGIVHGLSYLKKHNLSLPLYTDSVNAMLWVKARKCNTKLIKDARTQALFDYVERAENWLKTNEYSTQILKWQTENWGEIPADFGRKS
ncbi:MAG: ribonuclease H family protein [Bacteroidales bacterium]|jgi:ribonuclease HI|nr:ribonuclease H family protein [Bacteroidales bacterium]